MLTLIFTGKCMEASISMVSTRKFWDLSGLEFVFVSTLEGWFKVSN